jgi:hypothetical protein
MWFLVIKFTYYQYQLETGYDCGPTQEIQQTLAKKFHYWPYITYTTYTETVKSDML